MQYVALNENQEPYIDTMAKPVPKPDECLVRVKSIGVNRADILQRQGKYPPPAGESLVLGLEVCGEIAVCGANVFNWQSGDRVFGLVAGGGYAEYAVVKSHQLFSLPQQYSFAQGAAIAEVFLTAYQSLFTIAHLQPKSKVLIHAGASGVGSAAIQLARLSGCYVVCTVGSEEKANACLALGANIAVNYQKEDFVAWKKANISEGFDVIIDVVAGHYIEKNIDVAALDAVIVVLSMLGGRFAEKVDMAKMLKKRVTLTASTLRNRTETYKKSLVANFKKDFQSSIDNGEITPIIDREFSWLEVDSAHQVLINNQNIGKVILNIP